VLEPHLIQDVDLTQIVVHPEESLNLLEDVVEVVLLPKLIQFQINADYPMDQTILEVVQEVAVEEEDEEESYMDEDDGDYSN
jgi:hypothetical protein